MIPHGSGPVTMIGKSARYKAVKLAKIGKSTFLEQ